MANNISPQKKTLQQFFGYNSEVNETSKIFSPGFILLSLISLSLLFFTYSNHFDNPFQFDDSHTIENNANIKTLNIPMFFKDATTISSLPANQVYRPGLTTLNAIDYKLGGQEEPIPYYYHRSIFISFIFLGLFFFYVCLNIFNSAIKTPANPYLALFATSWMWLHTANAETINYIISRSDSFSTLCIVIAFAYYLFSEKAKKYYLYLIPMIIGFFVKEPAVMLSGILLLYIFLFEKNGDLSRILAKQDRKKLLSTIIYLIPVFIICVGLFMYAKSKVPASLDLSNTPWHLYFLTQPSVIVHYIQNFIIPINLVVDTDWVAVSSPFEDRVFSGALIILVLIYFAFRCSKKQELKPIAFGLLWFFVALAPTSSVISLSEVLNDHRTFFPYLGLFLACTWGIYMLLKKFNLTSSTKFSIPALCVCVIFLSAFSLNTHKRNLVWSSGETLWQEATIKSPNNGRAWMNYGNAMMGKGNWNEAEKCFTKTIELWPYYSYGYINMGVLKNATQKYSEAESNYKKALELNPLNPEVYNFYGLFLLGQFRLEEAKKIINEGIRLSPAHASLNNLLAQTNLALANRVQQVNEPLDVAIMRASNSPSPENYLELSLQFYNAGKYSECITAAEEALKLNPKYDLAYNNICATYNVLKQWDKAIEAGQKALAINPTSQLIQNNLRVSLESKKIEEAKK